MYIKLLCLHVKMSNMHVKDYAVHHSMSVVRVQSLYKPDSAAVFS